jgi:pimeloyl-ACP methyl ester carboxylesterase
MTQGFSPGRVVLLAPPARPAHFAHTFARAVGLAPRSERRMLEEADRVSRHTLDALDLSQLVTKQREPALIFHDRGDREVPCEQGRALAEAWPGAQWVELTGLGHRRLLKDPGVVARTVEFVRGRKQAAAALRTGSAL